MPSKTPHPLTGQCLHVHGAPVGGYEIPSNGIIHPHDTNGKKLQVFNVGRKVTLLEAAAKLELHIQKCLQQQGEWFLHSNAVLCAELSLLRPCCVLFSCAEATEPHDRSLLPQVHPVALAIRLKLWKMQSGTLLATCTQRPPCVARARRKFRLHLWNQAFVHLWTPPCRRTPPCHLPSCHLPRRHLPRRHQPRCHRPHCYRPRRYRPRRYRPPRHLPRRHRPRRRHLRRRHPRRCHSRRHLTSRATW